MKDKLLETAKEDPWKPLLVVVGAVGSVGVFRTEILNPLIIPTINPLVVWFDGMRKGLESTGMPDSAALWISVFVVLFPIYEAIKYRSRLVEFLSHIKDYFQKGDVDGN